MFTRYTGETFDPISPAAAAADMTIGFILSPDRAARMVAQAAVDPSLPGLNTVLVALRRATFQAEASNSYEQEIRRATARALVERLMELAGSATMPQVRAIATSQLQSLQSPPFTFAAGAGPTAGDNASGSLLAADIKRFLERPIAPIATPATPDPPPGAPIGDTGMNWLARVSWCGWGG
jgi:hypothetical protein